MVGIKQIFGFTLVGLVLLAVGAGLGYYCAPTKVKEVVKVIKQKDVKTHVVKTKKPDGTVVTVIDRRDNSTTNTERSKTVERDNKDWLLTGAVEVKLDSLNFTDGYMLMAQRRLLGELYGGMYATTDGNVGLALSFRF